MENEIRKLRENLTEFLNWAKVSQSSTQNHLAVLSANFTLLLNLLVSNNGAVELDHMNLQHFEIANKGGSNKAGNRLSTTYKDTITSNLCDDDDDVEDSLRVNPILLESLPRNTRKLVNKKINDEKITGTVTDKKLTTRTGEKLSSKTIQQTLNSKVMLIDEKPNSAPPACKRKKFEDNLRALKSKHAETKLNKKNQRNTGRIQALKSIMTKNNPLKQGDLNKHIFAVNCSPVLNLTREQFEINLKALHEQHTKSGKHRPIPEFYFEFGAARGWTLKKVSQKYASKCYNQNKRIKK